MSSEDSTDTSYRVEYTSEFKRNVRQLAIAKKYRRIKSDVEPVIGAIQKGETPGEEVSRTGEDLAIFKVRIRNSDSRRGKRGGYRMIYWVKPSRLAVLITIYSKSDQGSVSVAQIQRIVAKHS